MSNEFNERWLGFKQVVHLTGNSRGNIYFKMRRGRFPECVNKGGLLYWREKDIEEYRANPSAWGLNQAIRRLEQHRAKPDAKAPNHD